MDKVDLKKKSENFFFCIFLQSTHQVDCRMLERIFCLFQCSRNIRRNILSSQQLYKKPFLRHKLTTKSPKLEEYTGNLKISLSPGSKTNRSDSLVGFNATRPGGPGGVSGGAPIMGRRMSRNNSQSSSLLNNRLSLAEAAGPDALPPR